MFDAVELAEVCRKAAGADARLAGDDELCGAVVELAAARSALDAAEGHVLAELEARGVCDREFGLSTAGWVADRTRVPRAVATGRVRVATKLRTVLGSVDEALSEGRVGFDHARVLTDAANPRIEAAIGAAQDELVSRAEHAPFAIWRRQVAELVALVDQDGGFDPERELARNHLSLSPVGPDHLLVRGELVGDAALVVREALEAAADQLWRRYRTDHDQTTELAIPRRPTLLALGLAELCRQARGADPDTSHGPTVDVTLVMSSAEPDTLRTVDGDHLVLDRYRHLTCDPSIHALVVDSLGVPLDLGRTIRYANRAQRRALARRDGGCVFPGCDAPATWCDAHHVIPYESGGPTDLCNLALLCRHHHGVTHRNGWTMVATDDQRFTWTTPLGARLHSQRHRGGRL